MKYFRLLIAGTFDDFLHGFSHKGLIRAGSPPFGRSNVPRPSGPLSSSVILERKIRLFSRRIFLSNIISRWNERRETNGPVGLSLSACLLWIRISGRSKIGFSWPRWAFLSRVRQFLHRRREESHKATVLEGGPTGRRLPYALVVDEG